MLDYLKNLFDRHLAPPFSYITSFSHTILAISALWGMILYYGGGEEFKFGYAGLGLLLIQGCAGMLRFARTSSSASWNRFYDMSTYISTVFAMPFMLVDLYMDYGFSYEICYAHLVYPMVVFIPMIRCREKKNRLDRELTDMIVFISDISLCLISVLEETSYTGLIAALIHLYTYFLITPKGRTLGLLSIDFYNFGICIHLFFVLQSLICAGIYWDVHGNTACSKLP